MAKVTMPQLGESVAEGTIGKWLKQVGDDVASRPGAGAEGDETSPSTASARER